MEASRPIPAVLSIAGSDSGGGAGIQADLKAFARCGVHGMTAITAITAQSTVAVDAVEPVSAEMIAAQVASVSEDIGVDAVKVGMLGTAETVVAVVAALETLPAGTPVVVDPVMVSESGAVLLDPDARDALIARLLPLAAVVTPNLPEARELTRMSTASQAELAEAILAFGPAAVVVTGGHTESGEDLFHDGTDAVPIPGVSHPEGGAHGSGCTHSSALAAGLARGYSPLEAARGARLLASEAVGNALRGLGEGPGPVDVFNLAAAAPQGPGSGPPQ
jgi:hydroxymethylpyrimidine/phosphomethylpyrimidine kinase